MMGAEDGPDPRRDAIVYANEFCQETIIPSGPDVGRRCALLRLAGCNLTCASCPQPTTWGHAVLSRPVRIGAILDRMDQAGRKSPIGRIVVTGGEPLLQQEGPGLRCLVETCVDVGRTVYIVTNGTKTPTTWLNDLDQTAVIRWRVAPKTFGSMASDPRRVRIFPPALRWFVRSPHAEFLFHCDDPGEIDEVRRFCADYELPPGRVWIESALGPSRRITPAAIQAGFNVTTDLSVIMMGMIDR